MSKPGYDILPRILRLQEASRYLGMDKNKFNAKVRPYLTEVSWGPQSIGFDRLEIDAFVDEYMRCNGRPGQTYHGGKTWDKKERPVSSNDKASGTSTSKSTGSEFAKALAQLTEEKPKRA